LASHGQGQNLGMPDTEALSERALDRTPDRLQAVVEGASRHNVLMLAAGLAFFGILSIGPAIGMGFGLLRIAVSPEAADGLVELLEGTVSEQLGLVELLQQMEDRAGRYAGIGLLVLLWPATTLASGWTRALDDIAGNEATGGVRGLMGRLRGLVPGGILIGALFVLFAVVTFGTAVAGEGIVLLLAILGGGVVVSFALNLAIFRWLPSERREWHELWPGALWATLGVSLSTAGFALALVLGENLAEQYPPTLTTSIVLGMWLYGANSSLLLGAEVNQARHEAG
jgi:membrane protein